MSQSPQKNANTLITRYTMRRRLASLLWYSLVTLKNTSDASFCTVSVHSEASWACSAACQSCVKDWQAGVPAHGQPPETVMTARPEQVLVAMGWAIYM